MPKTTGKVCSKHPELKGERYLPSYGCVACHKAAAQRKASREYHSDPVKRSAAKARARQIHADLKDRIIAFYGGACEVCGIDDTDVLTLDHKNGQGSKHRKEVCGAGRSGGSNKMYRWVIANGFPEGFRILCFNHNIKVHLTALRSNRE